MTIHVPVSAAHVARSEPVGFRHRATAAVLDGIVLYTIIVLISSGWLAMNPKFLGKNAPPLVNAFITGCIVLYLLITGVLGRTLGMRALGLRIVRSSDGAAMGPRRALVRSAVLLAVLWFLPSVHPALVPAYVLWMLFNARRQMPHDQIAGTVVVRNAVPAIDVGAVGAIVPSVGALQPPQAQALLSELDQMRRRARGDLHTASVPVFVLAVLAAGGALVELNHPRAVNWLFWALAGPVGLGVTAWWFRRIRRHHGAGTGGGPLVAITMVATCVAIVFAFAFPLGGVITALGFLALALSQQSRVVAVAAGVFGLVTGAELPFRAFSFGYANTFPQGPAVDFVTEHGSATVLGVLALLLLAFGATTLHRERLG